ncbi:hypothetical protein AAIB41_10235 [Brucella sp. BE17]|uniref:hypothetical protein n=1 Tax=Brucella sp. BE17 TaxID=3142977 RepID=UPI0031BB161F
MQARTERRLGIAAALALTAATFVVPGVSTQVAQNQSTQTERVQIASAETLRTELRHFANLSDAMPKLRHAE